MFYQLVWHTGVFCSDLSSDNRAVVCFTAWLVMHEVANVADGQTGGDIGVSQRRLQQT